MSALQDLTRDLQAEGRLDGMQPSQNTAMRDFAPAAWFRDLPLSVKIRVIFGTFFGAAVAFALILAFGLSELYGRYTVYTDVQNAVKASADLHATTGEFRYNSARYVFGREQDALDRQRTSFAKASDQLSGVQEVVSRHVPTMAAQLSEVQDGIADYEAKFEELRTNLRRGGSNPASAALTDELSELGSSVYTQAGQFEAELVQASREINHTGMAYASNMIWLLAGVLLLGCCALVIGFRALSRDFADKVSEITGGMTRLANGDRDFAIDGIGRKDEIGEMLRALALFKAANIKMEEWAVERAERAQREQAEQEQAQAEKARVLREFADRFERTVGDVVNGVASASSQLQSTARTMANSAEEATARTGDVVKSMTEANSGANAAAAASDEFAMSIGEISRQAASSAELAREASETTSEADSTISDLSRSAEEVGQIVQLIQSIAQRTNLLALNASIEAARGGEAGRGFAVVASEVKDLATQASQATEQVAQRIAAIQDSTGASVHALGKIAGHVSQLESTAISIASAVDQQSAAGQDLARSIDMAARATNSVASHVEDVRELTLSTGAAASQVLSSSGDLERQARTLREQVDAFLGQVRAN